MTGLTGSRSDRCRSCNAAVRWVRTESTWMPLDPDPSPDGTVVERSDGRFIVLGPLLAMADERTKYVSHFVSCPDAESWRKPR